jgi:hypothetical protein
MDDRIFRTSEAEKGIARGGEISGAFTGSDEDDDDESLSNPTPTKDVDTRCVVRFSNDANDPTDPVVLQYSNPSTTSKRRPQDAENVDTVEKKEKKKKTTTRFLLFLAGFLRLLVLELPLLVVLFLYLCVKTMVDLHDSHFGPLFRAAKFYNENFRNASELTYYYRECNIEDLTTTTRDDLIVDPGMPVNAGAITLTKHGVAMFPHVLSNETASTLRDFILQQNKLRKSWHVIEGEHRSTWGIDINMHPAFHQAWKEVARNKHLMGALTDLVGPDPGTCPPILRPLGFV